MQKLDDLVDLANSESLKLIIIISFTISNKNQNILLLSKQTTATLHLRIIIHHRFFSSFQID